MLLVITVSHDVSYGPPLPHICVCEPQWFMTTLVAGTWKYFTWIQCYPEVECLSVKYIPGLPVPFSMLWAGLRAEASLGLLTGWSWQAWPRPSSHVLVAALWSSWGIGHVSTEAVILVQWPGILSHFFWEYLSLPFLTLSSPNVPLSPTLVSLVWFLCAFVWCSLCAQPSPSFPNYQVQSLTRPHEAWLIASKSLHLRNILEMWKKTQLTRGKDFFALRANPHEEKVKPQRIKWTCRWGYSPRLFQWDVNQWLQMVPEAMAGAVSFPLCWLENNWTHPPILPSLHWGAAFLQQVSEVEGWW